VPFPLRVLRALRGEIAYGPISSRRTLPVCAHNVDRAPAPRENVIQVRAGSSMIHISVGMLSSSRRSTSFPHARSLPLTQAAKSAKKASLILFPLRRCIAITSPWRPVCQSPRTDRPLRLCVRKWSEPLKLDTMELKLLSASEPT